MYKANQTVFKVGDQVMSIVPWENTFLNTSDY